MKIVFRRAKDTMHLVLYTTAQDSISVLADFPLLLIFVAALSCIGFVINWQLPIITWSITIVAYLFYRLRKPWEGEKLRKVQKLKINYD